MKEIKIGLLGFGTVASGVEKLLAMTKLEEKTGLKISIAKILERDLAKHQRYPDLPFTRDYAEILEDESIAVVVELTGTKSPDLILQALAAKKSVVTANKYLVARHYQEFVDLARKNQVHFYYEASVGGGIPLILAFNQGLIANQIESFYGILNGTCNYILSQMAEGGLSYETALAEAKELGYAEADESADVLGYDSLNKLVILTRLAYGQNVKVDSVYCEGIQQITKADMERAAAQNSVIKLIAGAEKRAEGLALAVYPAFVSKDELLAGVKQSYNALLVQGDAVGDIMLYGKGAGSLPTASAVISDIIAVSLACENDLVKPAAEKMKLLDVDGAFTRFPAVHQV